jgi:hypothetical protein
MERQNASKQINSANSPSATQETLPYTSIYWIQMFIIVITTGPLLEPHESNPHSLPHNFFEI